MNNKEFTESEIQKTTLDTPYICNICDLDYVTKWTSGNKTMIRKIMDSFLKEIVIELHDIQNAISQKDYESITRLAHKTKTTISIMGISSLVPILKKLEELGNNQADTEDIIATNEELNRITKEAIDEINIAKHHFE